MSGVQAARACAHDHTHAPGAAGAVADSTIGLQGLEPGVISRHADAVNHSQQQGASAADTAHVRMAPATCAAVEAAASLCK